MKVPEIVAALRRLGVLLHVVDDRLELDAADAPPDELVDAVKQNKPGVLALLVGPRDLFKRPAVKPGVPLVRDERDHGPNSRLSPEARAAGVTIPQGDVAPRRGRFERL